MKDAMTIHSLPTDPLTPQVREAAERSVLCWLATVDAEGQPRVSPKEIFTVFDERHLVIANLASPASAANLRCHDKVCVSFVDVFVQKGFKVLGTAVDVPPEAPDFSRWAAPLLERIGTRFELRSVFVVHARSVEPILAPSYLFFPQETTEAAQRASAMRAYGVDRLPPTPA